MANVDRTEWMVRRELDSIEVEIRLSGIRVKRVKAIGRCRTKKDNLWVHDIPVDENASWVEVANLVGHIVLGTLQDHPTTQEHADAAALGGEVVDQLNLF